MSTRINGDENYSGFNCATIGVVDRKEHEQSSEKKNQGKRKFQWNKETGILEVWKDGKKVGEFAIMGDKVNGRSSDQ